MTYLIISLTAFTASFLTLFSGFGLGTLLMPVMALFMSVPSAIAATAFVHLLNNLFKLYLFGRYADRFIVLKFGVPAVCAALLGAFLLSCLSHAAPIFSYSLFQRTFEVSPLNVVIATVLIAFVLLEVSPFEKIIYPSSKYLSFGGLLSGFFGGLSGHQGAFRSAFLAHTHLSRNAFVGTNVVIACAVDVVRLTVYGTEHVSQAAWDKLPIVMLAAFSAFAGVFLGNHHLKKVTMRAIQRIVLVSLFLLAVAIGCGFI